MIDNPNFRVDNTGLKADRPMPLKRVLADMERAMILQAMRNNRDNQSKAARQLGLSRSTLISRLKEYAKENLTTGNS